MTVISTQVFISTIYRNDLIYLYSFFSFIKNNFFTSQTKMSIHKFSLEKNFQKSFQSKIVFLCAIIFYFAERL